MEVPAHSFGQASVGWVGYGSGFRFFAHDKGRMHSNGESATRGVEEEETEGEEEGPGPP